jgi:urea transporter
MLPFAIGGLVLLRRRRIPIYPMVAVIVAISITVVLGFPVTRYRAAFDAVTPVLVAVAVGALWARWRQRPSPTDRRRVAATTEPEPESPAAEPAEVAR